MENWELEAREKQSKVMAKLAIFIVIMGFIGVIGGIFIYYFCP